MHNVSQEILEKLSLLAEPGLSRAWGARDGHFSTRWLPLAARSGRSATYAGRPALSASVCCEIVWRPSMLPLIPLQMKRGRPPKHELTIEWVREQLAARKTHQKIVDE